MAQFHKDLNGRCEIRTVAKRGKQPRRRENFGEECRAVDDYTCETKNQAPALHPTSRTDSVLLAYGPQNTRSRLINTRRCR
jgi:hypothetical protein